MKDDMRTPSAVIAQGNAAVPDLIAALKECYEALKYYAAHGDQTAIIAALEARKALQKAGVEV